MANRTSSAQAASFDPAMLQAMIDEAVERVRGDIADQAQSAAQSGYGNEARLLRGVLRQLDASLENASEGYLAANRRFAQASRDIEAVQAGRDAAMRGRTEDTIPAFGALTPEGQAAFRTGYVDPLIADAQKAGEPRPSVEVSPHHLSIRKTTFICLMNTNTSRIYTVKADSARCPASASARLKPATSRSCRLRSAQSRPCKTGLIGPLDMLLKDQRVNFRTRDGKKGPLAVGVEEVEEAKPTFADEVENRHEQ